MLVAISAAHGRSALFEAWAEHTASLGFGEVIVCLSEDGGELAANLATCEAYELKHIRQPNNPLAGKFNAALAHAMRLGAERIAIVPSDDFVSKAWVEVAMDEEGDYLFPYTCGILDSATQAAYKIRKTGLNGNAQVGTLRFGAGRVISRAVIEKIGGSLWPAELNKGLDTASHNAIIRAGFSPKVITTEGIPITDVKTDENLWPFQAWIGSGDTIKADEALHMCSPSVRSQIDALRK